ncbi:MAG: hypothetical protein Gaeavirus30_4 [Gaeavirus sp.]|uniref:Leucine rich repeat protein n=1 Tax=Gaeavirus sp. TaxID=2487767 RepID=A0A3G5A1D5_9VIRU|nr:MAG: hypothetical protein Gaeavirus30_4 [Gaeavirus sp.]
MPYYGYVGSSLQDISILDTHGHFDDDVIITHITIDTKISPLKCSFSVFNNSMVDLSNQVDFRKYAFVANIETIIIDCKTCSFTDFTCFKKLQRFDFRCLDHDFLINLRLPDTLKTLLIKDNQSLTNMTFPIGLQRLELYDDYNCSLADIIFPDKLRFINFGKEISLENIILPKGIEKVGIEYDTWKTLVDLDYPESLTSVVFWSPKEPKFKIRIRIPSNFTHIKTNYRSIESKFVFFPETLHKLTILDRAKSLNDLPQSIEELHIQSVINDVTNLPINLKKIIISDMTHEDIQKKFIKLPYGCVIINKNIIT